MLRLALLVILINIVVSQGESGLDVPYILLSFQMTRAERVEFYVACAVNQGSCDSVGNDLKPVMIDLVTTRKCSSCKTNREKRNFRYLLKIIPRKYPKCWRVMTAKFVHRRNLSIVGCAK